jgi:hypothetical protein
VSTPQKELPYAPVAVAPKKGRAAWVIERGSLSAPGDESEAKKTDVVEARLLKLVDPRTKVRFPTPRRFKNEGSVSLEGSRPRGWSALSKRRVTRQIPLPSSCAMALSVWSKKLIPTKSESEV